MPGSGPCGFSGMPRMSYAKLQALARRRRLGAGLRSLQAVPQTLGAAGQGGGTLNPTIEVSGSKNIPLMVLGTKDFKYWALGPSGGEVVQPLHICQGVVVPCSELL